MPGRLAGRADRTRLLGRAKARERSPTTPLARTPGVHRTLGAPHSRAPACRADRPRCSTRCTAPKTSTRRQRVSGSMYTCPWIDTSAQRTVEQLCGCVRRLALCPRRAPRYISAAIVWECAVPEPSVTPWRVFPATRHHRRGPSPGRSHQRLVRETPTRALANLRMEKYRKMNHTFSSRCFRQSRSQQRRREEGGGGRSTVPV